MLLLLQTTTKGFQTCPEFTSQWSSQNNFANFRNLRFRLLMIFFPQNFKFTVVGYDEIQNFHYVEKERSWSEMDANLGLVKSYCTYMGYLWPCSVQGHLGSFGALTCFPENKISKTLLLLQIRAKIYQTCLELSSQWYS